MPNWMVEIHDGHSIPWKSPPWPVNFMHTRISLTFPTTFPLTRSKLAIYGNRDLQMISRFLELGDHLRHFSAADVKPTCQFHRNFPRLVMASPQCEDYLFPSGNPEIRDRISMFPEIDLISFSESDKLRLLSLGAQLEANGELMYALRVYEWIIARYPNFGDAYFNAGNLLVQLEDYEGAIRAFDRALQINPKDIEALHNKANLLCRMGRYEQVLDLHRRIWELCPHHFQSKRDHILVLFFLGRREEALETYYQADELNHFDEGLWNIKQYLKKEGLIFPDWNSDTDWHPSYLFI